MDARLVRCKATDLDATWIGRQMIVGAVCGGLSDIERNRRGAVVALYVAGERVPVGRSDVAIYDTLGAR